MLKILFLILELNYAFVIGYIPKNTIPIFETQKHENLQEFFTSFETEIILNDFIFIGGKISCNFFFEEINNFIPYFVDFDFKTGIRYKQIEIGFSHYCAHPLVAWFDPNSEIWPEINYEGGYEKIYIKFRNKEIKK